jgi:hypothetical protein
MHIDIGRAAQMWKAGGAFSHDRIALFDRHVRYRKTTPTPTPASGPCSSRTAATFCQYTATVDRE